MGRRARIVTDNWLSLEIPDVSQEAIDRFNYMCERKNVPAGMMFETMVRSFDRQAVSYDVEMRMDFGKYAGMFVCDIIRTDTRYIRWLVNTSTWFKLAPAAKCLLSQMED